jgi:hypothetical protein
MGKYLLTVAGNQTPSKRAHTISSTITLGWSLSNGSFAKYLHFGHSQVLTLIALFDFEKMQLTCITSAHLQNNE